MGTVIHVDFARRLTVEHADMQVSKHAKRDNFLEKCRAVLDDDDYLDLLESIADPQAYIELDDDMKDIADAYFATR